MYEILVKAELEVGGENRGSVTICTANYEPTNVHSIIDAINNCASKIEKIQPFGDIHFVRTRITIKRPDGTVINEFNDADLITTKEVMTSLTIV